MIIPEAIVILLAVIVAWWFILDNEHTYDVAAPALGGIQADTDLLRRHL